jgi:tetratricopeptide (TPR) repeat protein
MGLFHWTSNQSSDKSPTPAQEDYDNAKRHYSDGNFTEALGALTHAFAKDINFKPLYQLAADCLAALGGEYEQSIFENALQHFNDGQSFSTLGDYYYEMEHYHMAVSFYEKAVSLKATAEPLHHNLAVSYARQFQVAKAHDLLNGLTTRDFWSVYFLYKCKILLNQTENVAQALDEMMVFLNGMEQQEGLAIPKQKVAELQEMYQRLLTVEKPEQHISEWHFIQYGSVVLDYFESEDYVAGGRYVASWDSNESIKKNVQQLKFFLQQMGLSFSTVAVLNNRNAAIVGQVIAAELGIVFEYLDAENLPYNALIVAADSSEFNDWEQLTTIDHGQVLYALNHNWLMPSVLSPDIIGFMSQAYYFPWNGGGLRMNEATNEMEQTAEDNRSEDAIAADIIRLENVNDNSAEDYSFYLDRKTWLKGIGEKAGSQRYNFMIESPVTGAYFS